MANAILKETIPMNILVTGGLGNIGAAVVRTCLQRGHGVTVFDVENRRTRKLAKRSKANVVLGDIRNFQDISHAVKNQDAIIHMAAILPPLSNENPDLCLSINVGGTENLIRAMKESDNCPSLIFVSSASVMGSTQDRNQLIKAEDQLFPMDTYSKSKIEAEKIIEQSGIKFCIMRIAGVLPTILNLKSSMAMVKNIFDMPLDARCEMVLDIDVATALTVASEKMAGTEELNGFKGFIAGGESGGFQMKTKDLVALVFLSVGLNLPDRKLFSTDLNSYYLDWYDTEQVQNILGYQQHTIEFWKENLLKKMGFMIPFVRLFKKNIMKKIEKESPYYLLG